jgi:predicted RNA binding protein YcfA (HicA-like mRNA interferase family)
MIFSKQNEDGKKTIPIPDHPELAKGTLKEIMDQAGIRLEELLDMI